MSSLPIETGPQEAPDPAARPHFSGLLVISPHLDDGVFGCGCWLSAQPRSLVLTVFAALPQDGFVTDWDARCGYASSREAVGARHREDDAALAELDALPLRLGFFDGQYEHQNNASQIAAALADVLLLYRPQKVALPLGLFHADHVLASNASLLAMHATPGVAWYAYADALYRSYPGQVDKRLEFLRANGVNALPAPPGTLMGASALPDAHHTARKKAAVARYASQIGALELLGYEDVHAPEQYWRLFWRGAEAPPSLIPQ